MTTIPPSGAVPPSGGPSALQPGTTPVMPAGGRGPVGNQVPSDSQSPGQQGAGTPTPDGAEDAAPPASTIAMSVSEGPIVVATVIGPARETAADAPGPAASVPPAPAGTQLSLRVAGVLPDLTAATTSASAGQLVGTVIGRTPAGQVIIDTAVGRLALAAVIAEDAAANAQIAFDIVAIVGRTAPAASLAAATALPGLGRRSLALGPEWPTLREALEALAQRDPALARQISEIVLPRADSPRFLAQLLQFLSTPATDTAALLGETAADALRSAGRGNLVDRLDGDLNEMRRLNASAAHWHVFYVPILDTTIVRQLRVFTRRRKNTDRAQTESGRFVVEVEFDGVGPLQIDGLVNKPRLDLILRSHVELPPPLQAGIAGVFGQTCDSAGLIGKIFFQTLSTFPVSPLDELGRASSTGMSV